MLYQIKSYLLFLLKSTNQHGVHSPFVFDLVTKCLNDNAIYYEEYLKIEQYRASLLKNKNTIEVIDLGVGSKITKQRKRIISQIAKNVSTSKRRAKLLYRLVKHFNCKNNLELGTSLGIGTHALSMGNLNGNITTIEGCPNLAKFSREKLKQLHLYNIEVLTGDFLDKIQNLKPKTFDLIFFDGNHQKEATLNYFESLLPKAHNNTIFIFDDIYWSKDMTQAWEIIKQHPKVTVSIDSFFWGFVFFRKEQQKEHFTIRL
jgi:predicted O-methyltransferase YrrM